VPRRRKDGLKGFFWPRSSYRDAQEMESVRAHIVAAIERLKERS
jgi:histidine triad (HIT) family protein